MWWNIWHIEPNHSKLHNPSFCYIPRLLSTIPTIRIPLDSCTVVLPSDQLCSCVHALCWTQGKGLHWNLSASLTFHWFIAAQNLATSQPTRRYELKAFFSLLFVRNDKGQSLCYMRPILLSGSVPKTELLIQTISSYLRLKFFQLRMNCFKISYLFDFSNTNYFKLCNRTS